MNQRNANIVAILIVLLVSGCSSATSNSGNLRVQKRTKHFTFWAENKAEKRFIDDISTSLENEYVRICNYIGCFPKEKIDVEIYSSLRNVLGYPGKINGYAGNGKIQLNSPGNDSECYEYMLKVPLHELVHVVFNKANNGLSERWISEGLAEYLADGPRTKSKREEYLRMSVEKGIDGGLHELSMAFSTGRQEETIAAYSIASDFVEYLTKRYGSNCIKKLIIEKMTYEKVFDHGIGTIYSEYKNELSARYHS